MPDVHSPIVELVPSREQLWVERRTAADRTGYDVYDRRGDTVVGMLLDGSTSHRSSGCGWRNRSSRRNRKM